MRRTVGQCLSSPRPFPCNEGVRAMQRMSCDSLSTTRRQLPAAILLGCVVFGAELAAGAEPDKEALIRDALSAAPPAIAGTAAVMDWDHTVLKPGSGAYTCHPTPPDIRAKGGREPMCLDKTWIAWADAWMNKK